MMMMIEVRDRQSHWAGCQQKERSWGQAETEHWPGSKPRDLNPDTVTDGRLFVDINLRIM